jgi:flavorubredoxin
MHPGPSKTRLTPTEIAPDTFVIHDHQGEGEGPVAVPLNTMVIRGAEPVVVDTGMKENREQYLADVFSLVDPDDVRWVFISHDDVDHTGNLNILMESCPNATLVINWFMVERMGASLEVAPQRWRWLGDGDHLDVGDRRLQLVRPPIFDSPTTRGLYDPATGVYWAADSFATPMVEPVRDVTPLDEGFWHDGMAMFNTYVSPWLAMVDERRYAATVDRVAQLAPTVMAGCHTPVIPGTHIAAALDVARRTPSMAVPAQPDQAVLDEIVRTLEGVAA